jgi:choline dehydrogenase-like flavoprotein
MKQYFRKHQTLEPFDDSITDRSTMPLVGENHGQEGPVRTSFNDWRLPLEDDVIKAADDATEMTNKPTDPWSGDHIGFFNTLGSVVRSGPNRGKRSYAARGYFEPNQGRPNLKVLCEALATNIELDGSTAKGVTFIHGGGRHTVKAKKEVILCGGVFNSPQILELSGIGDPDVLKAAGIDCKIELPTVGSNFQDHILSGTGYQLAPGVPSLDSIYNPEVMQDAQKAWMETQGGPLTAISSTQGFFPYTLFASNAELKETVQSIRDTPDQTPFFKKQAEQIIAHLENPKSANIQFVLVAATANWKNGVENQAAIFPPPADPSQPNGITLVACLEYPVSRGSVHITSNGKHPNYKYADDS